MGVNVIRQFMRMTSQLAADCISIESIVEKSVQSYSITEQIKSMCIYYIWLIQQTKQTEALCESSYI